MQKFRAGQRVKVIKGIAELREGTVRTIREINERNPDDLRVVFEDTVGKGYYFNRFKLLSRKVRLKE